MERDNGSIAPPHSQLASAADFAEPLLRALKQATLRGPRRHVDLEDVLQAAGLPTNPVLIRGALWLLHRRGFISDLVPLSNGGLLLSLTGLLLTDVSDRDKAQSLT